MIAAKLVCVAIGQALGQLQSKTMHNPVNRAVFHMFMLAAKLVSVAR